MSMIRTGVGGRGCGRTRGVVYRGRVGGQRLATSVGSPSVGERKSDVMREIEGGAPSRLLPARLHNPTCWGSGWCGEGRAWLSRVDVHQDKSSSLILASPRGVCGESGSNACGFDLSTPSLYRHVLSLNLCSLACPVPLRWVTGSRPVTPTLYCLSCALLKNLAGLVGPLSAGGKARLVDGVLRRNAKGLGGAGVRVR